MKQKQPLVKIPSIWAKVRSRADLRNYAGFALLKTFNSEGRIDLRELYKHEATERKNYCNLVKRLKSIGWIEQKGHFIFLRSYQYVWNQIGAEKAFKKIKGKNSKKMKLYYIPILRKRLPNSRKLFIKSIITEIERSICERKIRQIKYRLNQDKIASGKRTKNEKREPVRFSAESASRLLGYKSPNSGYKARAEHFTLSKERSELIKIPTKRGPIFRNTCRKILV